MGRLIQRLVIIETGTDPARVTAPIPANAPIKALFWRARRWDADQRVWLVDLRYLDALIGDLRTAGFECDIHDQDGEIHTDVSGWSA